MNNPDTSSKTAFEIEREKLHQQMLSAVSHDLKTPLSAIIGSLEIHTRFKDTLAEDKKQVLLSTALQEAYRLDSFITNILDMAKLDNGFISINKQKFDLKTLLLDSKNKSSHLLKDVNFNINSKNSETVELFSDPALLSRAISCLIDNAVKHGGNKIDIQYGQQDKTIEIIVSDNGKGIPPEKKDVIFDKYTRISRKDHQNAGTGLGLAICKSITLLLGGDITANNNPHSGAVFTISLPQN